MEMEPSHEGVTLGRLILTLLVTALCSQSLIIGFGFLVAWVASGIFGGTPGPVESLFWIPALTSFVGGPLLLGFYFEPRLHGLFSGFVGLVAMVAGYFLSGLLSSPLESRISGTLDFLIGGLSISLGIVAILFIEGRIKSAQERLGMSLGVMIGIALSVLFAMVITNDKYEVAMWSLPLLWVWLSAVFFPELLSGRTDWRGLLIWIAVMLMTTMAIFKIIFHGLPN